MSEREVGRGPIFLGDIFPVGKISFGHISERGVIFRRQFFRGLFSGGLFSRGHFSGHPIKYILIKTNSQNKKHLAVVSIFFS